LAVAIRYTQEDLPPLCTAGLRFALASIFMAAWARREGAKLSLAAEEVPRVILAGVLLYAQIGSFHWGLTQTNSSHASVLIGAHPVIVAFLAHYFLPGDRLTWVKVAGLLLASLGLVLVVGGSQWISGESNSRSAQDPATLRGDLIVLSSSLLLGVSLVYTKLLLRQMAAGKILFWSYALATCGFLATSAITEPLGQARLTAASFWGLMYQSLLVAGFCFAAWTALLRRHRASQLAVFSFGQPLFGMFFGHLFRNDPLTIWLALGGLAIAAGILLVTRGEVARP
jgi:drug/metabolite transporter (DMT)-like permease